MLSRKRIPWMLAGVSILMMSAGIILELNYMLRVGSTLPLLSHQGLLQISTLFYALVGAYILGRHPRNSVGWLFTATAFFAGLTSLAVGYAAFESLSTLSNPDILSWTDWIARWSWLPVVLLPTIFVFIHFPAGRLPGHRWTVVACCAYLGLCLAVLSIALHPKGIESWDMYGINPFGIPGAGPFLEMLLNVSLAPLTIGMAGGLLTLGLRFRRSTGIERAQMKWLVFAIALYIVLGVLAALLPLGLTMSESLADELIRSATGLGVLAIVMAAAIAILRYQLYNIDLVINRTLVYSALTAAVFVVYLLVIGALGLLFQARANLGLSLVGVGIVAVLVQPLQARLQRGVNRLMYGERDDPYSALSRLGQRLEHTLAPEGVLATIVETVAITLKLPFVAITMPLPTDSTTGQQQSPILATYGQPPAEPLPVPLVYQGDAVGTMLVSPRWGEAFSEADHRLLEDLARQAGIAVHAVRLTSQLQRSREHLVTAREEERRRLRRDLHDGLGSQLAALHLRSDTLRKLIPAEASAAQKMATEMRDEIHEAVADIRRLVYELRPPALDELGLTGAIRALVRRSTAGDALQVALHAPDKLPALPAAVEMAAYRITQEALTNVIRHAQADTCDIHLSLDNHLALKIVDDGVGPPSQPRPGIGLRSMRERAQELGGVCTINAVSPRGTQVMVQLPLSSGIDYGKTTNLNR